MPIVYDKLYAMLKEKGVTTYRIRKEKIINQGTLQRIREGKSVSTETMAKFCKVLDCQPGDLMEYVPDDAEGCDG